MLQKPIEKRLPIDTADDVEAILALIAKAIHTPGLYEISIAPKAQRPSPSQRGLYRIWVRQIANHTGNTQGQTHKGLAELYLTTVAVDEEGNETIVGGSTEDLDHQAMSEYMEWVAYFAQSTLGLRLDSKIKVRGAPLTTDLQRAA